MIMSKVIKKEDFIVTTVYGDLQNIDAGKVLTGLQGCDPGTDELPEGTYFVERRVIKRNTILPTSWRSNDWRIEKEQAHCNSLGNFIDTMGIDYSKNPPIVEYHPNGILDQDTGKTYYLKILSGNHSAEALEHHCKIDIDEWVFDVYSYDSDAARQIHIARINGSHPPSKVTTPVEAVNHTTRLIRQEKLKREDIRKHITITYPAVSGHDMIVASINKKFDYTDESLYTASDMKTFMENIGLGVGGKVVNGRANYACKEGYEDRHSMHALLKWYREGIHSDIHIYTGGSTDKESLSEKRWKVVDSLDEIKLAWLKLHDYMNENESREFPWDTKDFVSQRNKEGETGLLTHDQIEPRVTKK